MRRSSLRVNRIRAASKIAPLLSRQQLSELPLFFRIAFFLLGIITLLLVLALIVYVPYLIIFAE